MGMPSAGIWRSDPQTDKDVVHCNSKTNLGPRVATTAAALAKEFSKFSPGLMTHRGAGGRDEKFGAGPTQPSALVRAAPSALHKCMQGR